MLSDAPIRVVYACDGVVRSWPLPAGRFDEEAHVRVFLLGTDGIETELAAGYTVDLVARTVTCPNVETPPLPPLPAGSSIAILRGVPFTQDLDGSQPYTTIATIAEQLDDIVMQTQQLAEELGRAVTLGPTDTTIDTGEVLEFLRNCDTRLVEANAALNSVLGQIEAARLAALGDVESARLAALADIANALAPALTAISNAHSTALTEIGSAHSTALTEIGTAHSTALTAIGTAHSTALTEIGNACDAALLAINDLRESSLLAMVGYRDAAADSAADALSQAERAEAAAQALETFNVYWELDINGDITPKV